MSRWCSTGRRRRCSSTARRWATTAVTALAVPARHRVLGHAARAARRWQLSFTGDVDEVRIWSSPARDFTDRGRRLTGIEPGLVAYYRMDEGGGTAVSDSTRNSQRLFAGTPQSGWASNAPVGDGPGLSRDTFALRRPHGGVGIAATLYYQQEAQASGYSTEPVRRTSARAGCCWRARPPGRSRRAGRRAARTSRRWMSRWAATGAWRRFPARSPWPRSPCPPRPPT